MTIRLFDKGIRLGATLFIIAAAGCIDLEQTIVLDRNGAGTYELKYVISEHTVTQMKAVEKLKKDLRLASGETVAASGYDYTKLLLNPTEGRIRNEIEKYATHGLTVERLRINAKNAQREVTIRVKFDDISKLSETDFFKEHGFSISKEANGRYTIKRPASRSPQPKQKMDPETVKTLMPLLTGFKIVSRITTPGRVIKANAHRISQYTSTWTFDFDKDPEAVNNLQDQSVRIVFDGEGVSLPTVKGP